MKYNSKNVWIYKHRFSVQKEFHVLEYFQFVIWEGGMTHDCPLLNNTVGHVSSK